MTHLKPTRLLFIRHAQSEANARHIVQGWGDAPLTELGWFQARQLAVWLREHNPGADRLIASPLQRAYQTACMVGEALDLPVQTDAALKEIYMGELENVEVAVFDRALAVGDIERRYGVETQEAFDVRVIGGLERILTTYQGSTIMIVAHLGVICTALAHWVDQDTSRCWELYGHACNTGISELLLTEQITLLRHSDAPHLMSHMPDVPHSPDSWES